MNFAVLFLPQFPLQAVLRHEPELRPRPVALVDPALARPNVVQLTTAARARGVREDMTPSQALARCGELVVKSRSREQELEAAAILLQTAYAFSPNTEATADGVCTLELKRLGLEFGASGNPVVPPRRPAGTPDIAPLPGELAFGDSTSSSAERWAKKILDQLGQFHLDAQIGFAQTPELALLAARAARPVRFAPDSAEFIAALPVEALGLPPETAGILEGWGVRTAGELLALGKNSLAERLGPAALALFERLSSASVRPLKLTVPPETFEEQMEFEAEIETLEPLRFVVRRFVEQLSRRLELAGRVVGEFRLRLGLADGTRHERRFKIPSPTGNVETLFRVLDTHLETVRTDAPIVSLRLGAAPAGRDDRQLGLFEPVLRQPNRFAQTVAQLMALCGADRVGAPAPEPTHRPDTFRMQPPEFERAAEQPRSFSGNSFHDPGRADLPVGPDARPRALAAFLIRGSAPGLALRRFRPPLPAGVKFHQQRPASIHSPAATGAVVGTRGPFLGSGNWWDAGRWSREEWDVQTADGALYRIFRSPEGCFVEGVYD